MNWISALGEFLLNMSRSLTPQELLLSIWHRNSIFPTARVLSRIAMLAGHSSCRVSRPGNFFLPKFGCIKRAIGRRTCERNSMLWPWNSLTRTFSLLMVSYAAAGLQEPTIIPFKILLCVVRHRKKLCRWPKM